MLLLDAGRMGGEASWAGAGMLAPGGEIEQRSPWNDLAVDSLRLYPGFVSELAADTGNSIDFQQHGAMDVALSEEEWDALQERGKRQRLLGIPSCPLTAADVARRVPLLAPQAAGALFYPEDAAVDPRDILQALRAACLKRAVELREGVRVLSVRQGTAEVVVGTSDGEIAAATTVLAAGAWTSEIDVIGHTLPQAFPVRGHLLGYRLAPGSLGPIVRRGNTYLLQRGNGFTIAGSSSERAGFDRTLNPAIVSDIRSRAAALVPDLAGRQPDEEWLGFRPGVEGDLPAIGRLAGTSLFLAYGHYRNGILMAPATASQISKGIIASLETGSSGPSGTR